jgi:hypothetical protein
MCKLVKTPHRYIFRHPFSTKNVIRSILSIPKRLKYIADSTMHFIQHWTYLFISQIVTSSELKITTHSTLYKHSYTVQTMLCVPSTVANSNGKHIFQKNGCTVVIMRKLWEKLKHAPYRKKLNSNWKTFLLNPVSFTDISILFFVGFDVKVPGEPRETWKCYE